MSDKGFTFTGRHAAAVFIGAFGLIFSVNFFMAYNAVSTFPGIETRNSYIASQTFDDRRAAQESLQWDVGARHADSILTLSITGPNGRPVQPGSMEVTVGRPTSTTDDRSPAFTFDGQAYVAEESLPYGNWDMWIEARALDGTPFTQRLQIVVER